MDDQLTAELNAIISGGDPAAVTPPEAAATSTPPGEAAAPPIGTPAAAPALDEQTSRKIAISRRAQEQAVAAKRDADARLAELASAQAKVAAYEQAIARAKATGDIVGLARAHGIDVSQDHAKAVLATAMGKDAPVELQRDAKVAELERLIQAQNAQMEADKRERLEREQQTQAVAQEQARVAYVRAELLPHMGEAAVAVRALAADPEFGDSVIRQVIGSYQSLAAQYGEVDPVEAFKQVNAKLMRMVDLVRPAAVQDASKPKIEPPAEKPKPAPTIGKSFTSSTGKPVTPDDPEYEEQVRAEMREMYGLK